jgi:hypothetical protein
MPFEHAFHYTTKPDLTVIAETLLSPKLKAIHCQITNHDLFTNGYLIETKETLDEAAQALLREELKPNKAEFNMVVNRPAKRQYQHLLNFAAQDLAQAARKILISLPLDEATAIRIIDLPDYWILAFQTEERLGEAMQALIVEKSFPMVPIFNQRPVEILTIASQDLHVYAECTRLIHVGAAGERNDDGSHHEDGIEKFVDDLDHKGWTLGLNIICEAVGTNCHLEPMGEDERVLFQSVLEEEHARERIVYWAKIYFEGEEGEPEPEVEVLGPVKCEEGNTWTAELHVDASSNHHGNPIAVSFRINEEDYAIPTRIEYPDHTVFFENAEAIIWHQERKTAEWTEYYLLLKDGDKIVSVILKHNAGKNEVQVEPYRPADFDYTVHDFCDHDGSKEGRGEYCCLDDPESDEFQEEMLASQYALAVKALGRQIKQAHMAEELLGDKRRIGG